MASTAVWHFVTGETIYVANKTAVIENPSDHSVLPICGDISCSTFAIEETDYKDEAQGVCLLQNTCDKFDHSRRLHFIPFWRSVPECGDQICAYMHYVIHKMR